MFELWVPITLVAVVLQTLRTGLQKHLKATLTTSAITFVRFLFGVPFATALLAGLTAWSSDPLPAATAPFLVYAAVAGIAQILGTFFLIHLFSFRNFAVGTTYSKTEAIQTAVFGFAFLHERISLAGLFAILISMIGVMLISVVQGRANLRGFLTAWTGRVALFGFASGAGFAMAAIGIRAASLSLESGDFFTRATVTLFTVTAIQTVLMGVFMWLREPSAYREIRRNMPFSVLIGFTSVAGSLAWFSAITLQKAAYVRTLGQVELVLSLLVSYLVFREKSTRYEVLGMVMIVIGIIILLRYR